MADYRKMSSSTLDLVDHEIDRERLFSAVLEQTADLIMITDTQGRIVYVNPAWETCTGYTRQQALGRQPSLLNSGKHDAAFFASLWQELSQGHSVQQLITNAKRNGDLFYEEKTLTPVRDADHKITHYVSIGKDVTQQLQQQNQLTYLTHYDGLTGLPNRRLLIEQLEQQTQKGPVPPIPFALLCLGLDRFKGINESLGNRIGDQLLQQVTQRVRELLGEQHTFARSSGDEFLLLLRSIRRPQHAAYLAHKILHELEHPFWVGQREVYLSASIGITLFPQDSAQASELMSHAEMALNRAKQAGGQQYCFFTNALTAGAVHKFTLENDLRQALLRKEFFLEYQPRISLITGQLRGMEALIRWQPADGMRRSPAEFIPLLEEMGLITSVGEWVLHTACRQAATWRELGLEAFKVSVNLSAKQFVQKDFCQVVDRCLEHSNLPPEYLELEVTESLMIQDLEKSVAILHQLRAKGVSLAIDDFGAGYSSLGYLKHLPVNTLKIDKGFIDDLARDPADAAIVQAVTSMAHRMGLEVTAEGVEDAEQLDLLISLGCEEVQGFFLARPMSPEQLIEWFLVPKDYERHLLLHP